MEKLYSEKFNEFLGPRMTLEEKERYLKELGRSVLYFWVKKLVKQKEWDGEYRYEHIYCNLGTAGEGREKRVKMGFLVAKEIPEGCEELTDDECLWMDEYRRAHNFRPFVTKDL